MGRITLAAWFITTLISYFALGGLLGKLIEGYDRAALSLAPAALTIVALLVSLALTVYWQMRRTHPQEGAETETCATPPSARRRFLFGSLAATGGILVTLQAAVAKNFGWYSVTGRNIFMVRPPYKGRCCSRRMDWRAGQRISTPGSYRSPNLRHLARIRSRHGWTANGRSRPGSDRAWGQLLRHRPRLQRNGFGTKARRSDEGTPRPDVYRDQILSPQRTRRPGQLSERLHRSGERLSCAAANGSG